MPKEKKENLEFLGCNLMKYDFLKIEKQENNIYELTFNNPNSRNALNDKMLSEIIDCLETLKRQPCRLLIITGEGKAFSAGADLEWMKKSINLNFQDNVNDALNFSKMLKLIDTFPSPTISVINGHAFGGGLGIICTCDFSIANVEAKFSFSEVRLGLIPAMIGPYVLRNIGFLNSRKLFLTGEVFNAEKALKINLIDIAINKENIQKEKEKLIENLLKGGPRAQCEIKKFLLNIYSKNIDDTLISRSAKKISEIRVSKEGQEGIKSFLEQSKPKW